VSLAAALLNDGEARARRLEQAGRPVRLEPGLADARQILATPLARQGRHEEAAKEYPDRKLAPERCRGPRRGSRASYTPPASGRGPRRVPRSPLRLVPEASSPRRVRGALLAKSAGTGAIAEYRRGLADHPDSVLLHGNLGVPARGAYRRRPRRKSGRPWRRAFPRRASSRNLGTAILRQGRLDEAAGRSRRAGRRPGSPDRALRPGVVLGRRGDLAGARGIRGSPSPNPRTPWRGKTWRSCGMRRPCHPR